MQGGTRNNLQPLQCRFISEEIYMFNGANLLNLMVSTFQIVQKEALTMQTTEIPRYGWVWGFQRGEIEHLWNTGMHPLKVICDTK